MALPHILQDLIPELVKKQNGDIENQNKLTKEEILENAGLTTMVLSSVHKYIRYLGYIYSKQEKSYYTDVHDNP